MAISIKWVNDDQTILLLDFEGKVCNDEILPAYQEALNMIREIDHPIHSIVDHTREIADGESFATILPQIGDLELPPNLALIIHVGTRGPVRARTQLYSEMYRKLHQVDLIEDAYALIKVYEDRRAQNAE